jgi:hypothetical protein
MAEPLVVDHRHFGLLGLGIAAAATVGVGPAAVKGAPRQRQRWHLPPTPERRSRSALQLTFYEIKSLDLYHLPDACP